jgi:hypothetical protein
VLVFLVRNSEYSIRASFHEETKRQAIVLPFLVLHACLQKIVIVILIMVPAKKVVILIMAKLIQIKFYVIIAYAFETMHTYFVKPDTGLFFQQNVEFFAYLFCKISSLFVMDWFGRLGVINFVLVNYSVF